MVVLVVVVVFHEAFLEEEGAVGIGLVGILLESLNQFLVSAIDVEVVGVGGGDDRVVGVQLEEGAVVFISLHNNIFAVVVDKQVAVDILRDAAKECRATNRRRVEEMSYHGTGSSLAVGAGDGDALAAAGKFAEHLGAFLDGEALLDDVLEDLSIARDGRGIYHEVDILGYFCRVIVIMDAYSLFLKPFRQRTRRAVIAADAVSALFEEAGQGTHADATDTDEVVGHL